MMKAEILSIGSELTSGQNLDTNGQWLSLRLEEIGIPVGWHTTIADDRQDNIDAFRVASMRAQLVLATGGLGPTLDDLTREVVAKVADVDLVFHEPSMQHIQEMFARRNHADGCTWRRPYFRVIRPAPYKRGGIRPWALDALRFF